MPQDEITKMQIQMRECEMKIERIIEHERKFNQTLDSLVMANADFKLSISEVLRIIKDIPEKIVELEKKQIEKTTFDKIVNAVVLVVVGMLVNHFIQNQVIANRDENKYKLEKHGQSNN